MCVCVFRHLRRSDGLSHPLVVVRRCVYDEVQQKNTCLFFMIICITIIVVVYFVMILFLALTKYVEH